MRVAERVLAIAADRGAGHPDGRYCYGSGFLVAGRTVLTAAHVVADAQTILLDDAAGNGYTGRVTRIGEHRSATVGEAPDLALVEIDDDRLDVPPFPVARIDRQAAGRIESARVVGWPRFMDDNGSGRRSTFSSLASIDLLSRIRDGLFRVDVHGSPPTPTATGSAWQGFSGAPVIVDGHLVAVVTTHGLPEGSGAVTAVPVTAVEPEPGDIGGRPGVSTPHAWWPALGLPGTGPPYVVRPGPPGPACVVHHDTVLKSLRGYRANLLYDVMPYVAPADTTPWHPRNVWRRLLSGDGPGAVLLTGHGGIGKTRTLLEVADLALEDGWTVLHVQAGNASAVVDHLTTFIQQTFAPVLVVLDYLNLSLEKDLDLAQLLALVARHRHGTTRRAAVIASVRSGWLLSSTHRRDVASLDQIRLEPSDADLATICASLAWEAAPSAVRELGLKTVLRYTGVTRPVLALLVAQQIEQRAANGLSPLPRPNMDAADLRQWLEFRLDEDRLLPRLDTPSNLWGSEVATHIEAAAAVFLGTPADEETLVEIAARVLGNRALGANVLRLLTQMGWLAEYRGAFDVVHDLVTDFLAVSVLFWTSTRTLRPEITGRLMDAVSQRATSFEHAVVALSRLLDDLADDQLTTQLHDETDAWLRASQERIGQLLLTEPATGARTASTLLRSGLLATGRQLYWEQVFGPLLAALGRSFDAYPLLQAIVREMPEQPPRAAAALADSVLSWLANRPLVGIDQLLCLLLERNDLAPGDAHTAAQLGTAWLRTHARDPHSDFLLNSLLSRDGIDQESEVAQLVHMGLAWLADHGTQQGASFLLSTLWSLKRLPADATASLAGLTTTWLERYAASSDASFVLRQLFVRSRLPADFEAAAIGHAAVWLARYGREPEASFVLAPLLALPSLSDDARDAALARAREWLEANPDNPATDYLLDGIWSSPALPVHCADAVQLATERWLARHGMSDEATFLLETLVRREDLPPALDEAVVRVATAWLTTHGPKERATYPLQALLERQELPPEIAEAVFQAAGRWLQAHGTSKGASFPLQALLRKKELPPDVRRTVFAVTTSWLAVHGTNASARFVLQPLLRKTALDPALDEAVCRSTTAWLDAHGTSEPARFVLHALLHRKDLPAPIRDTAHRSANAWLRSHGRKESAAYLLAALIDTDVELDQVSQETNADAAAHREKMVRHWLSRAESTPELRRLLAWLLDARTLSPETRRCVLERAVAWLVAHGGSAQASRIIERVLASPDLPTVLLPQACEAAKIWLSRRNTNAGAARSVIRSLFTRQADHPQEVAGVIDDYLAVVEEHPEELRHRFRLASMLDQPGLSGATRDRVVRLYQTWLAQHAGHLRADLLIATAVQRTDLTDAEIDRLDGFARTWLAAHGAGPDAGRFVRALLESRAEWSPQLQRELARAARSWCAHYGDQDAELLASLTGVISPCPEGQR